MPSPCNKSPALVFLIYQLPLILSTTPTYSIVFPPGSAFPLFHYNGSLHISHSAHLLYGSLYTVPLHPLLPAKFHKAPFSAKFFSIFIPLLFALSSVLLLSLTSYMLMTHNSSYLFVPKNVSSAINNLQSTITLISYWMSSNYLTLNPSKT